MTQAYVSVGSNINPSENVRRALDSLSRLTRLIRISTVYMTEPYGRPEQPGYYNCVVEIETEAPPLELKHGILRRIEEEQGRERGADKYGERTIDLDLITYGDMVIRSGGLEVPDPEILTRPYLAVPLSELAPGLNLPGTKLSVKEAASAMRYANMEPLFSYTEELKNALGIK